MFLLVIFCTFVALSFTTLGVDASPLTPFHSILGVDVSQLTPFDSWQCLKSNMFEFANVRVYRSLGAVDKNGPTNMRNAWNAGFAQVNGYIFPCYLCGNPAAQVENTINYLKYHNVMPRTADESVTNNNANNQTAGVENSLYMLWFDIEWGSFWSDSAESNINFLQIMVEAAKTRGVPVGIYASESQWKIIMGGTTIFNSLPLWYPHYDNIQSFADFSQFGGWTRPAMKQYAASQSLCSTTVDTNYIGSSDEKREKTYVESF